MMTRGMQRLLEDPRFAEQYKGARLRSHLRAVVESELIEQEGAFFLEGLLPPYYDLQPRLAEAVDLTDAKHANTSTLSIVWANNTGTNGDIFCARDYSMPVPYGSGCVSAGISSSG